MTDNELPDDGAHYELAESFDIDDGSLSGVSPELAFVLGVEWESVWHKLVIRARLGSFEELVHRKNVDRLTALAARHMWVATARDSKDPAWAWMRFVAQMGYRDA